MNRNERWFDVDPIDLARWIADRRAAIDGGTAGPVFDDELRVLVVSGRGPRLDYHVNTVAELFYQLEGDIGVRLREGDTVREITVRTGELWLAPAGVPHAPQRPVGTVGLVVERARPAGVDRIVPLVLRRVRRGRPRHRHGARRSARAASRDRRLLRRRECPDVPLVRDRHLASGLATSGLTLPSRRSRLRTD